MTVEAPPLQTDRADTGLQIETKAIAELPLATNRNFENLLNLRPAPPKDSASIRCSAIRDSLSTQVNGRCGTRTTCRSRA